jgi:predicted TIM-barrel fold metal-dependent hydrolase
MPALQNKIDVHSHYVPEGYREACIENGHAHPDGMPGFPAWSEDMHLSMMDSLNIKKAYLSITSPGTHLVQGNDDLARRVTRNCNVAAANFKKSCPDRIGFFASTPLPDVAGTLEEIKAAFDKSDLNADGIVVETNHHGTYLGDKKFDTVMQALNEKKAVVFIHPTTPCLGTGQAATPLPHIPQPMLEFFFETARAVANLFISGTVSKYPHITYIISHCGGALPPLIRRMCGASPIIGLGDELSIKKVRAKLNQQFYFDTSGWPFPEQMQGLMQHVSPERILYGTDFPWTPIGVVTQLSKDHDEFVPRAFPDQQDRERLCFENAQRLLLSS